MKGRIFLVFFFQFFILSAFAQKDFLTEQLKSQRFKTAWKNERENVESVLKKNSISQNSFDVFLRIFKKEAIVEVYAKNNVESSYKLIQQIPICSSSGTAGPKNKQGDLQVPEGIYRINVFNAYSSYHLSLGLNYPNEADKKRIAHKNYGGDIFIHGKCVTIGCMPLTDPKIEWLYSLCVKAKSQGQQKINVAVFPCKFTAGNEAYLKGFDVNNSSLSNFWNSLKKWNLAFEKENKLPVTSSDSKGNYTVQ